MFRRFMGNRAAILRTAAGRLKGRLTLAAALWLTAGLAFSVFIVWGFAEITEDVLEGDTRGFDRAALVWIHNTFPTWLDGPMRAITALGYYRVVLPLMAVSAILFYLKGWRLSAVLLIVSTAGGIVLTTVLKTVFQRQRPELFDTGYVAGFFSYPSGHATVAVGFYGALALILAYHLRGFARWLAAALGALLVVLIGFSRLYLGVHYPTDVLAGFLSAPLWLVSVGTVYVVWLWLRRARG
ncbi:MAG: phosphatase PAP2 family protein [Actinomycetota bacterium]